MDEQIKALAYLGEMLKPFHSYKIIHWYGSFRLNIHKDDGSIAIPHIVFDYLKKSTVDEFLNDSPELKNA